MTCTSCGCLTCDCASDCDSNDTSASGPGCLNFTVYPGDSFARVLTLTGPGGLPFDLTGYTAAAMVITDPQNGNSTVDTLSVANSRIVLGGTAGTITLSSTPLQQAGYPLYTLYQTISITSGSSVVSTITKGTYLISVGSC